MPIVEKVTHTRVPIYIYTDEIEPEARAQLENIANLPFIHGHVAAMPDVHYGIGATVGSVIPARGAIIPAAYKETDRVMAHQEDLVEVVHRLQQLVCVKG